MIQRTYENALRCSSLEEVVVATDDFRIFDHVKAFGGQVVMTDANFATGTDRLAAVARNEKRFTETEIFLNIQGDEPLLDPKAADLVVACLKQDPHAVMSTAIVKLRSEEEAANPNICKCVIDTHGYALYFSRSVIPGNKKGGYFPSAPYYKHVGIYAYRKDFLHLYATLAPTPLQLCEDLEQLKVLEHGFKIKTTMISHAFHGVDTPSDIIKIEQELCTQNISS